MSNADTRNFNRFIPREDVARVSAWDFGAVDEGVRAELARLQAAAEADRQNGAVAERLQQAHDAGFESGFADGAAQAAAEAEQRLADYIDGQGKDAAQRLELLHAAFAHGLDAARQRMARGILDIACALARQVVRRELAVRPDALEPVVREALDQLLADGKPAVVRLHPEDHAALAGLRAGGGAGGAAVAWLSDAAMPPGDCQVESAGTVIDGRLASRWARALAPLGLDAAWDAVPAEQADAEAELRDAAGSAQDLPVATVSAPFADEAPAQPQGSARSPQSAAGAEGGLEGTDPIDGPEAEAEAETEIDAADDGETGATVAADGSGAVDALADAGIPPAGEPAADPFAGIDFDSLFDANTAPPAPRRAAPGAPETDDAA
jgi:flagellar assembly protein FliH